jgi:hypothetical protein
MFCWEDYHLDLVQIDAIDKICRVLVRVQGITEHSLPDSWEHLSGIAKKELFLSDIEREDSKNLLDALMLLANSRENLREMDKRRIYDLFNVVKVPAFGESQTKIDVINSQIMELDMPTAPEQADDDDDDDQEAPKLVVAAAPHQA